MELYQKIIREEIEKYILKEDFNSIISYRNKLKTLVTELGNYRPNITYVEQFLTNLTKYTLQIIFALDRCARANTLNESLHDYGIELPQELNVWNNVKNSYRDAKNYINRNFVNGGYTSSYARVGNPNNLPTEKLSVLLSKLQQYQTTFNKINGTYNLDFETTKPREIMTTIASLQQDYIQTTNAQGNP